MILLTVSTEDLGKNSHDNMVSNDFRVNDFQNMCMDNSNLIRCRPVLPSRELVSQLHWASNHQSR